MDDLMPCDLAFTDFLVRVTAVRVRRDNRPNLSSAEIRIARKLNPPKRRADKHKFTKQQMDIAKAAIRSGRQQKESK